MKKIMVALAVVAFAAVSQAATVDWSVDGIQVNGSWDDGKGDLASGYAVYLFNDAGAYSRSAMASLIAADTWKDALGSSLGNFIGNDDGAGLVGGITVDNAAFTGYMVIFDAATAAEAKNAYITTTYTVADNSVHAMKFNDFDDGGWINATATGSGTGWTAVNVPEPTSGLLLLLGMAGLALRRKQA